MLQKLNQEKHQEAHAPGGNGHGSDCAVNWIFHGSALIDLEGQA